MKCFVCGQGDDVQRPWTLEADEVVGLPLDELALLVLRDAHDDGEWNWRDWLRSAKPAYSQRKEALQALGEAWRWLDGRGLISWHPEQDAAGSFIVSRRGHATLVDGLPWLRAVERLDLDLLPALERTARPQFLRGDFESAAFAAMKEVEVQSGQRRGWVRVRTRSASS